MKWIKNIFSKDKKTDIKTKSSPLIEGSTKTNIKKYSGSGRQAPPPPKPSLNKTK